MLLESGNFVVYASNTKIQCVQVPFEPDYRQLGGLVGADRLRGIQTDVQQQQADWVSVPEPVGAAAALLSASFAWLWHGISFAPKRVSLNKFFKTVLDLKDCNGTNALQQQCMSEEQLPIVAVDSLAGIE